MNVTAADSVKQSLEKAAEAILGNHSNGSEVVNTTADAVQAAGEAVKAAEAAAQAIWGGITGGNTSGTANSTGAAVEAVTEAAQAAQAAAQAIFGGRGGSEKQGNASNTTKEAKAVANAAQEAVKAASAAADALRGANATTAAPNSSSDVVAEIVGAAEKAAAAAAAAAQAVFGGNSSKAADGVPNRTTVQVTIEASSVPEDEYLTTGVHVKLKATLQAAAEDLDTEASHADAETELKLRVMGTDAVRKSHGVLDGALVRLVANNCTVPGLETFQLTTGVNLKKALRSVTTMVDSVCVLEVDSSLADGEAQKALDAALLRTAAVQRAAAASDTKKALRRAHDELQKLAAEALAAQNSTLSRAVAEARTSGKTIQEALQAAVAQANATLEPETRAIHARMHQLLTERLRVRRDMATGGLAGTLQAGNRFASHLREALPVPSVGELAVQVGMAGMAAQKTQEAFDSFEKAAAAAQNAQADAKVAKQESREAGEAADRYRGVAHVRSLQAEKMRQMKSQPGGGDVYEPTLAGLDAEAKEAAVRAGSYKQEEEELRLLYERLIREATGNATEELLMAKSLQTSLEGVLGASAVADVQSKGATAYARSALRKLNATEHAPISLVEVPYAGLPGNVTVRVDIAGPNSSEIHEVIVKLEERLKAKLIADSAVLVQMRSEETASSGHLKLSALVGSLDSTVIGDAANTTAETIHEVLGQVVTDIQKVQIKGLPGESGEGLPIRAATPGEKGSTTEEPSQEAELPAHRVRGPWSLVGLVGIAVLGALGLLLVLVSRYTGDP